MSSPVPPPNNPQPAGPQVTWNPQGAPLRVVVEEPKGRLGKFARRMLWSFLAISLFINLSLFGRLQKYVQPEGELDEKYHSLSKDAADKVAIVTLQGTIMSEDNFLKKQIDAVRHDDHVKAVVLRIDSPGGTVTGSDYLYHHLTQLVAEKKIPLVVSMGAIAASGGYYVAMAAGPNAKTIYAEPSCWTGSIGVIIPHYDLSALLNRWDVQDDSIASHPLKQMGSPTAHLPEPYREQERAILKQLVDSTFDRFKQIVLDSRPELKNDPASQEVVFTGRIFTAGEAKQQHLVDELGFVEDAIDRAVEMAGLTSKTARVIKYHKPVSLLDQLLVGSQDRSSQFDLTRGSLSGAGLATLFDLSAPRAYYLCTMLPAALKNE
ncbi:MAG TPA: signal peptide peptidase SppA [Pirellulales bacterium]|nr:signal peptide peptidase SppA [Pirellulales bacterium]